MSGTAERSISSTLETELALNEELFDSRTAELGATTERERAAAAGISRATLDRWRRRGVAPRLKTLDKISKRLQVPANQLIKG